MPSDFSSIKVKVLLMYSFNSSDFSSDFSSFVLNTLPLSRKIHFAKKPMTSSVSRNNSAADSRT